MQTTDVAVELEAFRQQICVQARCDFLDLNGVPRQKLEREMRKTLMCIWGLARDFHRLQGNICHIEHDLLRDMCASFVAQCAVLCGPRWHEAWRNIDFARRRQARNAHTRTNEDWAFVILRDMNTTVLDEMDAAMVKWIAGSALCWAEEIMRRNLELSTQQ